MWSGLRSCFEHGRGPSLLYRAKKVDATKKRSVVEETNKVKRWVKIVKRGLHKNQTSPLIIRITLIYTDWSSVAQSKSRAKLLASLPSSIIFYYLFSGLPLPAPGSPWIVQPASLIFQLHPSTLALIHCKPMPFVQPTRPSRGDFWPALAW